MQSTNFSPLWALVDCNNFYASCEQLFRPDLHECPVVVLSNNDGCIIARSKKAKALGIPMGEAWFKIKPLLEKHNTAVFSANFALYGDISNRIMGIIEKFCPKCEQYSIDEAFLQLDKGIFANLPEFCSNLRHIIKKWTGITVSIGIGKTPTLAKAANKIAKQQPEFNGVFSLARNDEVIDLWLADFPVKDVWGIGKGHERKLAANGIRTALDLKNADDCWLRKELTITGLRCALELRGTVCETSWINYDWKRKTIMHSRSFGRKITGIDELGQALATFCARCAEKMRAMQLLTKGIWIRAKTSVFDGEYKDFSASISLKEPAEDTRILLAHVSHMLQNSYVPGYAYAKAAVMFFDLVPKNLRQPGLFEKKNQKSEKLMAAVDAINNRYGKLALRFGSMGLNRAEWHMRQEMRSPDYTVRWQDLPIAKCG